MVLRNVSAFVLLQHRRLHLPASKAAHLMTIVVTPIYTILFFIDYVFQFMLWDYTPPPHHTRIFTAAFPLTHYPSPTTNTPPPTTPPSAIVHFTQEAGYTTDYGSNYLFFYHTTLLPATEPAMDSTSPFLVLDFLDSGWCCTCLLHLCLATCLTAHTSHTAHPGPALPTSAHTPHTTKWWCDPL